ncbi:MAG: hypothetical protein OXG74_11940 [Acidobacteria bacterium]|nr:hypothetical protein [Acidobacteriota bacterium]
MASRKLKRLAQAHAELFRDVPVSVPLPTPDAETGDDGPVKLDNGAVVLAAGRVDVSVELLRDRER